MNTRTKIRAGAALAVGGLTCLSMAVILAPDSKAAPLGKVFVCKYVGTPGVDERLQTGQNPIDVSINAIPDYQGIGSYFADKQGRSFVLALDTGHNNPSVSECPGFVPPPSPTPSVTPTSPSPTETTPEPTPTTTTPEPTPTTTTAEPTPTETTPTPTETVPTTPPNDTPPPTSPTPTTTQHANGPTLTLVKSVINDANGVGKAKPSNFTLTATGPVSFSGLGGSAAIQNQTVTDGTYVLSESADAVGQSYEASPWLCQGNFDAATDNTVTLSGSEVAVCAITNTFVLQTTTPAPSTTPPTPTETATPTPSATVSLTSGSPTGGGGVPSSSSTSPTTPVSTSPSSHTSTSGGPSIGTATSITAPPTTPVAGTPTITSVPTGNGGLLSYTGTRTKLLIEIGVGLIATGLLLLLLPRRSRRSH